MRSVPISRAPGGPAPTAPGASPDDGCGAEATCSTVRQLSRLARVLSGAGQILVQASDESELLARFAELLTSAGGYPLAYVCFPVDDEARRVRVAAEAGPCRGYAGVSSDEDRGRGPSGIAIRDGVPVIARDIAQDPGYRFWRHEATRRGLVSSVALPLSEDGRTIGALRIFSRDMASFTDEELALLGGLAEDLAYGIVSRRSLRARREAELRVRLLECAVDASAYGVLVVDVSTPGLPVVYASEGFTRLTGYALDEVVGRDATSFLGRDPEPATLDAFTLAIDSRREGQLLVQMPRRCGTPFWNEILLAPVADATAVTHMVCTMHDVSDRKRYEEQFAHLITHDSLTGLANQVLFKDRLQQTLIHQERLGRESAVLLLDLDRFKEINASLGHAAADEVLLAVARRLGNTLREGDTVARLGVDQFAIMLHDVACEDDVLAVGEKLRAAVGAPVRAGGRELCLTMSIGVSVYPRDGRTADALLAGADAAMYRTKEDGGNAVSFFVGEMTRRADERLSLEARLRHALERDEFEVHYQPKRDLASGRLVGAEALVRWRADGQLVPPAEFIPVAEQSGLILPIGRRVLQLALAQLAAWRAEGRALVPIAVNLSSRQLRENCLARTVGEAIAEAAIEARWLELEITESMVMSNPDQASAILGELKGMGIALALDDFGTGYSSLGYLKRFPIDHLKIDRSFVRDVTSDPDDAAIIQAIIAMARSLRMKVIAEGVETLAQERFLRDSGCDMMQGYLFSRPLPAAEFSSFL